ncbi:hypothetical protein DFH09DRAFT_1302789 [Mycena vulgaris]|nr:hypothetical protein DFH09DRAFT_1302789 [Mycena vulgaris]
MAERRETDDDGKAARPFSTRAATSPFMRTIVPDTPAMLKAHPCRAILAPEPAARTCLECRAGREPISPCLCAHSTHCVWCDVRQRRLPVCLTRSLPRGSFSPSWILVHSLLLQSGPRPHARNRAPVTESSPRERLRHRTRFDK